MSNQPAPSLLVGNSNTCCVGMRVNDFLKRCVSYAIPNDLIFIPRIKTEIRSILQRGYFVLPDYGAVRSGLKQIDNILKRLKGGSFAITTEFSEVLSMATAAHIILSEVDEK